MSIVIQCEHCGATLKIRDEKRGKKAKCPKCQGLVQIVAERPNVSVNDAVAVTTERPQSPPRPAKAAPQATIEAGADDDVLERRLMTARPVVRGVVLVVLLIPILLASRLSVLERIASCFVPLMLTGTYRISVIRGEKFVTRFFLAFYPVIVRRCKMQSVVALNVKYGHVGSGMGTFLLFGPAQVIFGRIFDFLMPAIGGPYQIHLVTAKGRELVAWQGFSDSAFESTLNVLIGLTNAEVRSV